MGVLRRNRKDDVDVASCLANLGRLEVLERSGIMGAPPDRELDDLTKAAAEALGTPMAFMSMLDDRRAFFAAAMGIEGELAATRQNRAEATFCQYVVAFDDVLVVSNAPDDALVAANASTTDGGVRAYLGVPLRLGGYCLGSFCVVDTEPREWTDDDLGVLEGLAAQAVPRLGRTIFAAPDSASATG